MSIAAVPRGLGGLVSPLLGPVAALDGRLLEPDDALLHSAWCELPGDGGAGGLVRAGGGWSPSPARAAAAAVGEAVERLCAATAGDGRAVTACAMELGLTALDPARIRLFLPGQLEGRTLVAPDTSTMLRWLPAMRLPDLAPAWLPAQLVLLEPPGDGGAEPPITIATSNGLACGPDWWSAIRSGLLELVERDAFTLTWASRLELPQLRWEGVPVLERLERRLAPSGLCSAALDLSALLGVPVVLAVVRTPPGKPGPSAVGAAAGVTAEDAAARALAEAHAAFAAARAYRRGRGGRTFADDGSDLASFDDRVLFYADPRRAGPLAFLTASPERRHVGDIAPLPGDGPREHVTALCQRIAARTGGTAYAADLTGCDAAAAGVHVVRVVCPELCPVDPVHALRFLGVPRLLTGAHAAGLLPRPLRVEEVNPHPHPFP